MNVAVTAVGGGAGQGVLKCFKGTEYKTIGIDPDPRAAGLYMADRGVIGPLLSDPDYIQKIIGICKDNSVEILFIAFDAELKVISEHRQKFIEAGITPIISGPDTVLLSDNKWELNKFLKANDLPYIKTALTLDEALGIGIKYPMVLKQKMDGARSKNVFICKNEEDVKHAESSGVEFIYQEYIEGPEYTCGSVTFNKKIIGTIQMERELRDGDTYKAKVVDVEAINELLYTLLPKINPYGPCNVQLRMSNGIPYILEINTRCSGTTASRALAGFNEPVLICDYLRNGTVSYKIEDISIFRYWNEIVVPNKKVQEVSVEGFINGS